MRYYLIAGERSGDLHGAALVTALLAKDEDAQIRCMGGQMMKAAGAELAFDYARVSFMGFLEVVLHLGRIVRFFGRVKEDIYDFEPDALILIDFPGFNLRMARRAHKKGIKVFYYISPKVWAWNQSRVHKIKARVDKMFVILPFEKDFFHKFDYEVSYVGNPLVDAIDKFNADPGFSASHQLGDSPLIAIMPGSRKQELLHNLPILLRMVKDFPDFQFVVTGVNNLDPELYKPARELSVPVVIDKTYDVLSHSTAALVVSGTATLEAALFQVPQVVCYRTSQITYWIAKMLVKVNFISLVNLIAGRELVKELLQGDFTPMRLHRELSNILSGPGREDQLTAYRALRENLSLGNASEIAASQMVDALKA